MTLRDRLLAGEHHGCATWGDVARKFGCHERALRLAREKMAKAGTVVGLDIGKADNSAEHSESSKIEYGDNAGLAADSPVKTEAAVPERWSNLAAFDASYTLPSESATNWQPSDFRNPEALPYTPPASLAQHRLTRDQCPDGSVILWASDIHIPIHHEVGCRLMVEVAEKTGVTHGVIGGDGLDMNCLSTHPKESARIVEHATILEEVEPGRWLLNWFASKRSKIILGNHEDRLKRFVDDNPAFHGSLASNFAKVCDLPAALGVIPQGGEVRLGNLSLVHGDAEFKRGSGGAHPAAKLLSMFPDQSTICGHLHRMGQACRTTRDEDGIPRTRRAWTMGHMSIEEQHYGYVSKNPNWQMGFALIRVFWEGDRPRWTVYPIEILFDRYNRPYLEFEGRVYR